MLIATLVILLFLSLLGAASSAASTDELRAENRMLLARLEQLEKARSK